MRTLDTRIRARNRATYQLRRRQLYSIHNPDTNPKVRIAFKTLRLEVVELHRSDAISILCQQFASSVMTHTLDTHQYFPTDPSPRLHQTWHSIRILLLPRRFLQLNQRILQHSSRPQTHTSLILQPTSHTQWAHLLLVCHSALFSSSMLSPAPPPGLLSPPSFPSPPSDPRATGPILLLLAYSSLVSATLPLGASWVLG